MSITLVTAPATEPLSLTESKAHIRVTDSDSDTLITAMIQAAREYVEKHLGVDYVERTWDYSFDFFPDVISLPKNPVSSVTSVSYVDSDGNTQTLATSVYSTDFGIDPAQVYLDYDQSWPDTRAERNAVTVRFVSGSTDTPEAVKYAMLLMIGDLFENRESNSTFKITSTGTQEKLMRPFRRMGL